MGRCTLALLLGTLLLSSALQGEDWDARIRTADSDPALRCEVLLGISAAMAAGELDSATTHRLAERIHPWCWSIFFTPERLPGDQRCGLIEHRVQSGEYASTIASGYGVNHELLALLNDDFTPESLQIGQTLLCFDASHGPITLLIDRARHRLAVIGRLPDGGIVLMGYFPVGLGAPDSPTPLGISRIVKRVRDPEWTHPDTKERIAPTDPRNILGGYWLGMDDSRNSDFDGIGIHGYTGAPSEEWLNTGGSHGCIRMLQSDLKGLFALVRSGTRVMISEP